jgi:hypothetical protein
LKEEIKKLETKLQAARTSILFSKRFNTAIWRDFKKTKSNPLQTQVLAFET